MCQQICWTHKASNSPKVEGANQTGQLLVPVTPVARRIACGEKRPNFGRCGVGRGDAAWWFLEGRPWVTTGRTRLRLGDLPQGYIDSRFRGFNSNLRKWTIFKQESMSLKGQPTCVCCLDLGKGRWNLLLGMTSFSWTCKFFFWVLLFVRRSLNRNRTWWSSTSTV